MASSTNESERRVVEEEEETTHVEDEDTGAQVAPIVRLEEVAVSTGEENELVLLDLKSKLYRFDKEGNQWKERGAGTVKILKHKTNGKIRLVMRQSKTLKICANHLILPGMAVQEHSGNEKSCVWHATDFSDEELKQEFFCIRFGSVENCKAFMRKFEEVADIAETEGKEGDETAELLENQLKIEDGKAKDGGEEVPVAAVDNQPEVERSVTEKVHVAAVENQPKVEDSSTEEVPKEEVVEKPDQSEKKV
ncbi:hypothetical protein AQUCO_00400409v1 [Aquilegia coerulea]|uniref:RanBD1 domain-containing protein n=1 Tax=Aquilegia coerulea TaxID=218851 RepID=A0A2G5EUV3_AQUCA|nr:hypothetical protein AQUCO_00400409v1 [Aquilegia coerulea]